MELQICEDCDYSVAVGGQDRPILTCRNKAGSPGRLFVVDPDDSCKNFTRDNQLLAPELVAALAEGAKLIPLTQGKFAIIDAEDYDRLCKHKWHLCKNNRTEYAARYSGPKRVFMHRLLLNAPPHLLVDHRDCNGLNNRKPNLRLCTNKENSRNSRPYLNCSSRFKGVSFRKTRKKYTATIHKDGKRYPLGYFADEIEAAVTYDIKAMELFGDFAYLNFPKLMQRYKMFNTAA